MLLVEQVELDKQVLLALLAELVEQVPVEQVV